MPYQPAKAILRSAMEWSAWAGLGFRKTEAWHVLLEQPKTCGKHAKETAFHAEKPRGLHLVLVMVADNNSRQPTEKCNIWNQIDSHVLTKQIMTTVGEYYVAKMGN